MRYLIVDACLNGTGIRDEVEGGYVSPQVLGLREEIVARIVSWLAEYEEEHYRGYSDFAKIDELDKKGREIASTIKIELNDVKLSYYSDAKLVNELIQ
jgi:hypothetical protein